MNRAEYEYARQLVRCNGWYALRWLPPHVAEPMARLRAIQQSYDRLAYNASGWRPEPC